jgi:hypothetical protein
MTGESDGVPVVEHCEPLTKHSGMAAVDGVVAVWSFLLGVLLPQPPAITAAVCKPVVRIMMGAEAQRAIDPLEVLRRYIL